MPTKNAFTIRFRPETYRRLAELAAFCKEDVSDAADEIVADYLDEQEELEERGLRIKLGLCPDCGDEECEGECLEQVPPAPVPVIVQPSKE
ncbi:MAG TPA: hypothetical protein VGK01_26190 [Candidatus Angelobacter sp.]|jgi:hypothetical protein